MDFKVKVIWSFAILLFATTALIDGDGIRLPDQQIDSEKISVHSQNQLPNQAVPVSGEQRGFGTDFLNLVGLGTGPNIDPYVARTNGNCLSGELSECFKTHALNTFNEFFIRDSYSLTDNVRVVRMPEEHQRSLLQQPYEFSSEPRSTDSEWDQLIKFGLRKVERFVKSAAFEINVPEEFADGGMYSPRFIDGITDELDVIEDKKAPLFTRHKLKKLFIPLLLVLKVFKLKLLLFLPFILGLVSLKKFLGFAAIILPGLFAYFKLCRPQPSFVNHGFPQYSPQGIGSASFHSHEHFAPVGYDYQYHRNEPTFAKPYADYYSKSGGSSDNSIRFGENGQNIAYKGYSEYRSNTKNETK